MRDHFPIQPLPVALIAATTALLCSVAFAADPPASVPAAAAEAQPAEAAEPPAAPSSAVFVYPSKGQSAQQTDRDRYECHNWAVKQSGFDPSQPHLAPHQRVQVVTMPAPGANTMMGAITGALIGAAVSNPHNSGTGAVVGAVSGGLLGHAADKGREEQAARLQHQHDQRSDSAVARLEQQSNDYRRAISACLEGRGYTVK
ncbi:MAG TPA: glycine zipper 2TM domain-containing protein [Steroidobacteraceae bacterium]|nr:glycine zipper 2TM domain-containing protein [Steroidobacteraceae bacterium]